MLEKQASSGAEEYVSILIELAEPLGPKEEKSVTDALNKLNPKSIESLQIDRNRITACYDPTAINRQILIRTITEAGGKIKEAKVDRTPFLD